MTGEGKTSGIHRFFLNFSLQYCRVPKTGLPKNGQAGISSKNKNDPRLWEQSHHTQTAFAVKTTSSGALLTSKRLHFDGLKHFSRIPRPACVVAYRVRAAS